MAPEKVTVMILDVDLQCCSCYKKVKKVLCKFPQIRDQMFDEDKNKVRITVICCNPEKLRDKLCCKGGKVIQRIEIVEDKPKEPEKPKPKEPEKPKPKEPEKPVPVPVKEPEKPKPPPVEKPNPCPCPCPCPPPVCCQECYEGHDGGPCQYGYGRPVPPPPVKKPKKAPMPPPCHGYPPPIYRPICPPPVCCQECYEGRDGGPCQYGYGRQVPPPPVEKPKSDPKPPPPVEKPKSDPKPPPPVEKPKLDPMPPSIYPPICPPPVCCQECYEGRDGGPCQYGYGRPVPPPPGPCYDGYGYYGGNRPCYVSRCDYFSEENPQGCSVM